ncbi:regulatory protein RecX [Steroidobacter denitrificans]|uniref:regulatory protein RecX n=1 Tax=Steroidobacter denitrificans TaxID=465721 RepID=UPI00083255A1|nr:regulatory protein RecX [Steroidobacter denitrificans]
MFSSRIDQSTAQPAAADLERSIEHSAVQLLSRREHSIQELRLKLERKGYASEAVGRVIDRLSARRLVSDERFAAAVIRYRAQRGQGPVRIRAELRRQGISDAGIRQAFDHAGLTTDEAVQDPEAAIDWGALAGRVRRRKFGATLPHAPQARAKQARFLQYRGFTADQIRIALDADPTPDFDSDLDFDAGANEDSDEDPDLDTGAGDG